MKTEKFELEGGESIQQKETKRDVSQPIPSGRDRGRHLLSLGLVVLLLAGLFGGNLHYQHDLQDRPDCPICILNHHAPAGPGTQVHLPDCPVSSQILSTLLILPAAAVCVIRDSCGRAPPL